VNALEGTLGIEGGYDAFKMEDLNDREKALAWDLMKMIKNKYYYDIDKDQWIDSIDKEGNITYE